MYIKPREERGVRGCRHRDERKQAVSADALEYQSMKTGALMEQETGSSGVGFDIAMVCMVQKPEVAGRETVLTSSLYLSLFLLAVSIAHVFFSMEPTPSIIARTHNLSLNSPTNKCLGVASPPS